MRDIPSNYLSLLDSERRISARATIRDKRLIFTPFPMSETNFASPYAPSDSCALGNGIFRVGRNTTGNLCYQSVTDPSSSWPNWTETGIQLDACRPGVVNVGGTAYIFTLEGGSIYRRYYTGAGLSSAYRIRSAPPRWGGVAIAPVSNSEVFIQYFPSDSGGDINNAHIRYITEAGSWQMPGAVYGDMDDVFRFDAEKVGDKYYIFTSDDEYGRPLLFKMIISSDNDCLWSDSQYLLPLDILDDTSFFKLGASSYIDGKIFVTGRLKRSAGVELDVYMMGVENYTLGRDMFIVDSTEFTTAIPAKLLLVDDEVYYVGHGNHARAPATNMVGYDASDKKTLTQEFRGFSLTTRPGTPWRLDVDLASDLTHDALRRNSELILDVGLQEQDGPYRWAQMGVFGVDALGLDVFDRGQERTIVCRGSGVKRLIQWTSDAYYDYWSQTKMSTHPSSLSEVIRASGQWSGGPPRAQGEEDTITLDDLNTIGILFSASKACRGGMTSANFYNPVDPTGGEWLKVRFGVGMNYYRESRAQAAERLDKKPANVTEDEFGDNGIFAVMGYAEHATLGSAQNEIVYVEGVALYSVVDGNWTRLTSSGMSVPTETWFWMMIKFQEGDINVYTRNDSVSAWTLLINYRHKALATPEFVDAVYVGSPWKRDQRGKGAIIVENTTVHTTTPGFHSDAEVIPVDSIDGFPMSETVIVDSEQIIYDGKADDDLDLGLLRHDSTAHTFLKAPHDNLFWTDVLMYTIPWVEGNAGEVAVGKDKTELLFITQAFEGPFGYQRIDRIKIPMKKVGNPTVPVRCWIVGDDFDNESPPPQGVGRWDQPIILMCSAPVLPHLVNTDYNYVEFDFGNCPEPDRWLWEDYPRAYYICVTTVEPYYVDGPQGWFYNKDWDSYVDASNYYMLKLDDTVSATTGILRVYENVYGWSYYEAKFGNDSMIPYQMYGRSNMAAGHEIYITNDGPDGVEMDRFNDMALVVDHGPGAGTAFKVIAYDWWAPRQWVPSRTYIPPDNWEDHVGDPEHGDWVDYTRSRFFVSTDPSGFIGHGTHFRLYAGLVVDTRGDPATAHGPQTVSIYTDQSASVNEMHYYSADMDMRVEDMGRELAAKAGILDFEAEKDFEGTVSHSGDWQVEWMDGERRHAILKFDTPSMDTNAKAGMVWRAVDNSLSPQSYICAINKTETAYSVEFWINEILTESFPLADCDGAITISAQEDSVSVWVNDLYICSFADDTLETGESVGVITRGLVTVYNVDWSAVDIRVDNFVLDLGYRGNQLMAGMIGAKNITYMDTQDGGIKMARMNVAGDAEYTLSDLTVDASDTSTDFDHVNRVRAEGAEIAEAYDLESLREDGNLFTLINATEANDEWEVEREARFILADSKAGTLLNSPTSAADPRIEPNDIVKVRSAEAWVDVIIASANFRFVQTESQAIFDMRVEGRNAGS